MNRCNKISRNVRRKHVQPHRPWGCRATKKKTRGKSFKKYK